VFIYLPSVLTAADAAVVVANANADAAFNDVISINT